MLEMSSKTRNRHTQCSNSWQVDSQIVVLGLPVWKMSTQDLFPWHAIHVHTWSLLTEQYYIMYGDITLPWLSLRGNRWIKGHRSSIQGSIYSISTCNHLIVIITNMYYILMDIFAGFIVTFRYSKIIMRLCIMELCF